MDRIVLHSRVGSDGVLHVTVPVGAADADREVDVTIDEVRQRGAARTNGSSPGDESWRRFVVETGGAWQGEFVRPEQGAFEEREKLA
jgi:hypothetical protein